MYDDFMDSQIGKFCLKHPGHKIKSGKWGNWCGAKTELGTWCEGNTYTHEMTEGEPLIIQG